MKREKSVQVTQCAARFYFASLSLSFFLCVLAMNKSGTVEMKKRGRLVWPQETEGKGHLPCSAVHSIELNLLVVNLSPRSRQPKDRVHLVSLSCLRAILSLVLPM